MSARRLIEHLRGLRDARAALVNALGGNPDELSVYYICPLSNLRGIVSAGILPNNSAPRDRTDLSGQGVQALRDIDLNLTQYHEADLHDCVNLFWNPLNWTLQAFQRNGLIREAASNNSDEAVVCILELDLENLLLNQHCRWTVAPQNVASSPSHFTTFSLKILAEGTWPDGTPKCDWNTILSTGALTERAVNRKRSAELIVYYTHDTGGNASAAVPFGLVRRIIVPAPSSRQITAEQLAFLGETGKPVHQVATAGGVVVFHTKDELLKSERRFLISMQRRQHSDANVLSKLNAAFEAIKEFEKSHRSLCPIRENFSRPEGADGLHGSLHSTRVMFWSAFLAQHVDEATRNHLLPAILTAAALHDTCRENDQEDTEHGRLAASKHRAAIAAVISDPALLAACLSAIEYHCLPDDQCPQPNRDLIWQVLKDADALDRGRFTTPGRPGGCDPSMLRMDLLKAEDSNHNIPWMAYAAAQISRYTPIGANPCSAFNTLLCDAVNILAR